VFDNQNYISLINPLGEKTLQTSSEETLGKSLTELAEKNTSFKLLLKLVSEEIKEVERQEIILEKKTLEISSLSILKEGERIGGLIILHDITHEKVVEKMKTEFVSIAAHQLRTPLSGVKWALSLLLEEDAGKLNEEQKSLIQKSYSSNERMINLVNDILNVARIEEGNYIFKLEPTHLEDLVKKTIDSCQELSEKKGIIIDYKELAASLPLIMADSEKITLAVQNLIENAVKYTQPAGQVTISLKNDTNKIEFSIKDTGVGIAEEQKERIFTKFFRAPNVMRIETDGTGLGLFISKNIIESHGGKIWFESEENAGSTFYFWLPTINK
jgi:signal transduction histidine kinase